MDEKKITSLSDEQLQQVAGGEGADSGLKKNYPPCPSCGSTNVEMIDIQWEPVRRMFLHCRDCGTDWAAPL